MHSAHAHNTHNTHQDPRGEDGLQLRQEAGVNRIIACIASMHRRPQAVEQQLGFDCAASWHQAPAGACMDAPNQAFQVAAYTQAFQETAYTCCAQELCRLVRMQDQQPALECMHGKHECKLKQTRHAGPTASASVHACMHFFKANKLVAGLTTNTNKCSYWESTCSHLPPRRSQARRPHPMMARGCAHTHEHTFTRSWSTVPMHGCVHNRPCLRSQVRTAHSMVCQVALQRLS